MNTCRGNSGVAALVLNLGARRGRVVNITPRLLYPEEEPGYLLHRTVFLNRRAASRYRALASIIPGSEGFSWN